MDPTVLFALSIPGRIGRVNLNSLKTSCPILLLNDCSPPSSFSYFCAIVECGGSRDHEIPHLIFSWVVRIAKELDARGVALASRFFFRVRWKTERMWNSLHSFHLWRDNWVLSTGLIMWIGHRKEIRELTFPTLALRHSLRPLFPSMAFRWEQNIHK